MFDAIKRLLTGNGSASGAAGPEVTPETAATVLLVEAARADGVFDQIERRSILAILREAFDLDDAEAENLLARGEALADDAIGAHRYTMEIKTLSEAARLGVVEGLYRVAFADGENSDRENAFVRHVASLLHVEDVPRAQARRRAEAWAASQGDG